MDDRDFSEGLKDKEDKQQEWNDAAESFLKMKKRAEENEKNAGIVSGIAKDVKNPWILAGALGLGGAGALAGYLGSKPREELKGKSKDEAMWEEANKTPSKDPDEESFAEGQRRIHRQHALANSQVLRRHPGKASALGGLYGAGAGVALAKLLGASVK